ncbi:hypothetical protein ONO23_03824 [Micromonospora noduli]|uniref:hypothetical protein n=1 Tax=Micromonospora noduli TaxID=709876 RepID=UPI000DC04F7C|nr:hypothetical protein [Micromonospora noduli]RAO31429.1 hypothetical protein ONO23_03824 [Micromonospora noduli]
MTSDDSRRITVQLWGVDDEQYADIANVIWMQMQAVGCEFTVKPDIRTDLTELDRRWDDYSQVSWEAGAKRGASQAVEAGGK